MSNDKVSLNKNEGTQLPKCGIVMPISSIDNCSAEHWSEVLSIMRDVINDVGFEPNLVSDADDIGIIQKRIIQNLYSNEIVVCDVSCKNPNVMFELGLRLAFDKATIIIKDDKTDYTFDTSIIEHLTYPRDLRFNKILSFKENLKKKIQATYAKSKTDPNYSTFLKNFGEYKIAHLTSSEITSDKYILNSLEELKSEVSQVKRNQQIQKENITPPLSTLSRIRKSISDQSIKDEVKKTVELYIKEYLDKFNLDRVQVWVDKEKTEKLLEFLEEQREVRTACGDSVTLRQVTNEALGPF